MRLFNNSLLIRGILPMTACIALSACVDDKYDLTDIDTTSRLNVNNLTVPVNLSEIKIDDVIDLDDNENISKILWNGKQVYAIKKGGDINTSEFNIAGIHVNAPVIPSTDVNLTLPSIPSISVGNINFDVELPEIPRQDYNINLNNVDDALLKLNDVKTLKPISIKVVLSIPQQAVENGNNLTFKGLTIQLPWGLITDETNYDKKTGYLTINELPIATDGKAQFTFDAMGLDLEDKGNVIDHNLTISGQAGVVSGKINFDISNINLPSPFYLHADYSVSSFDIASFSGKIDYKMDDINIAPISLSDLPDFLDNPETEIRIADPTITVDINNPVGKYGLKGSGIIKLTSNFNGGTTTVAQSDAFTISTNGAKLAFCTPLDGYTFVEFSNLGNILTNSNTGGLPESITVNLESISFDGDVTDFPIGSNIGKAVGDYEFTAPLGFASPSRVVYETTEDGWGSDDLDDLNIQKLRVTATCTTNLPVGIILHVTPVDKYGNLISIKEPKDLVVSPMSQDEEVLIEIEGANGPIRNLDGVRFRAIISQDGNNTAPLGPDLQIILKNIRATVDGYYETDF